MRGSWVSCVLLGLTSSGCLMAGNYHSARTLEKGTSAIGMNFSMTRYTTVDQTTGEQDSVALPNVIPEVTYHTGITDDLEMGGRVAPGSLGVEFDVKYRFLRTDALHLAIAPAVGYQAAIVFDATSVKLPLVATFDLADNFSLNAAIFAGTADFRDVDDDFDMFHGTLAHTGASLGIEIRGETFVMRPAVEWTEYVADFRGGAFEEFRTFNVVVHFAGISGREKKQLNRMERKLDRVIDNTEGRPHDPNEPPPTDDSNYPSTPMK